MLTFLLQTLSAAKTVRAGVAATLAQFVSQAAGREMPSPDPSAYSQARQRLPEAVICKVFQDTVEKVNAVAGDVATWCGRRVVLIDGSSVSMPDTPELQSAFPQPSVQEPGCGFPVARTEGLFCWNTGTCIAWEMGSLHDSEAVLFRRMLDHFKPGDVALADRYYCSYVDIARLRARRVDVVFRIHQTRRVDFRKGTRLGPDDQLVKWMRPTWQESFGISREEFERLPKCMTLRMVRIKRTEPGFRSKGIVVVTTILEPSKVSSDQLLDLYRDRWLVELNFRCLKTTFGMEILRGHSVDVVRKEIFIHLILYNMIRLLMWEAARQAGRAPRRLSFAGTLHRLQTVASSLLLAHRMALDTGTFDWLISCIAQDLVPDRPNRVEPRCRKRRPKPYPLLNKPRAAYQSRSR